MQTTRGKLLYTEGMTQREIVLEHLERFGSITALEGLKYYGIMNTQGRISDLRRHDGVDIITEREGQNDHATYRLNK